MVVHVAGRVRRVESEVLDVWHREMREWRKFEEGSCCHSHGDEGKIKWDVEGKWKIRCTVQRIRV